MLVAGVSGCSSGSGHFDRAATEARIRAVVAKEVPGPIREVTCPDRPSLRTGSDFVCTLDSGGVTGPVRVRVDVGEGRALTVALMDAVVDLGRVAAEVRRNLEYEHGRDFRADCGRGVRSVRPGSRIDCTVADGDQRVDADVTVTDAAGTLSVDVRR